MGTIGAKRGVTARRIAAVLKRKPNLTAKEIAAQLPDLTKAAVYCAVTKMTDNGIIAVRGQKAIKNAKRGRKTAFAYCLKDDTPVAKAHAEATWSVADIKPEPEGPKTPKAEREVLVLRHLTSIYKSLDHMADHQEVLVAILKDTLLQLDAAERELERERQRRNWWDKVKELF